MYSQISLFKTAAISTVFLVSSLVIGASHAALSVGAALQLNADLAGEQTTALTNYRISPDSKRVIYVSDEVTEGTRELFQTPIDRSTPERQHGDLSIDGSRIGTIAISPDQQYIVYLRFDGASSTQNLYSQPFDGGAPVKLSTVSAATGGVVQFRISPDSQHVIFTGDLATASKIELYTSPITGGGQVRISPNMVAAGDIFGFQISSDSQYVAFMADDLVDGEEQLFSAPIDGATATIRVNDDLVAGGDVRDFLISPDSQSIVYTAYQDFTTRRELYSATITGGNLTKISDTLIVDGGSAFLSTSISNDSQHVAYRVETTAFGSRDVYSSRLDGVGAPLKLNSDLPAGASVDSIIVSPTANRVIYRADQNELNRSELFSVPFDSNNNVKISGVQPEFSNVQTYYRPTPDGQYVFFRADAVENARFELFRAPMDGSSEPIQINSDLAFGSDVGTDFIISPDGSQVAYLVDYDDVGGRPFEFTELFITASDGSTDAVRVHDTLVLQGDIARTTPEFSADGNYLLFQATQNDPDRLELYSVRVKPLDELCWAIKSQNNAVISLCL